MKKKILNWAYFIILMLILWQILFYVFHNSFILPSPFSVFKTMCIFLKNIDFYIAFFYTVVRVIFSIFISFFLSFLTSFICVKYSFINNFFSKLLLIIRTLPNVTIIILLLFWIPKEMTVLVVTLFLLFPIIHEELYNTITQINHEYKDLFILYHQSFYTKFKFVYLPLMKGAISSTLISTGSLAFKVIIMAEILAQTSIGVGRQIQISRLNIELQEVMAWTIWIIIFVFIFNSLYKTLIQIIYK